MKHLSHSTNWNLTDLYAGMDDPQIEADFKASDAHIEKLKTYRSKIKSLSADELLELIQSWENEIGVSLLGV